MNVAIERFFPLITHESLTASVTRTSDGPVLLSDTRHDLRLQVPQEAVRALMVMFRQALRTQQSVVKCDYVELRWKPPYWILGLPGLKVQPLHQLRQPDLRLWLDFLSRLHAALEAPINTVRDGPGQVGPAR